MKLKEIPVLVAIKKFTDEVKNKAESKFVRGLGISKIGKGIYYFNRPGRSLLETADVLRLDEKKEEKDGKRVDLK
ncbi:MAG: hypothetical protein WAV41_03590 [Microgenomates group bacterium]